jgi:hypothetical protein
MKSLNNLADQFTKTPRRLFLIDGLGAVLSAMMLGFVLVPFNEFFGFPVSTLYVLAALPCVFTVFDAYAYFKNGKSTMRHLSIISTSNILYCIFSVSMVMFHFVALPGWIYILLEITIVLIFVLIENKTIIRLRLNLE